MLQWTTSKNQQR